MLNVSWAKKRAGFVRVFAVQEGRGCGGGGRGGRGKMIDKRDIKQRTSGRIGRGGCQWRNGGEGRGEGDGVESRKGRQQEGVGGVTAGCFGLSDG